MSFLDIWSGTESELLEFHSLVNIKCSALTFTIEFHQEKMSFLDVPVLRNASGIETTLYRKPTDRNTILHGQSYHPVPLKNVHYQFHNLVVFVIFAAMMKIFNSNHKSYQIDSEDDHNEKSGSSLQRVVLNMCHNRIVLLKNKKKSTGESIVTFNILLFRRTLIMFY